jgi:hypothetical protein
MDLQEMTEPDQPVPSDDPLVPADPLAPATFFEDSFHDDLMEICIRLGGELWTSRERVRVLEAYLVAAGVIEPHAIDESPVAGPSEMVEHRRDRQAFVERIFGGIIDRRS